MRIIVSYFFHTIPLGQSCAAALESLGHEVLRFESEVHHPLENALLKPLAKIEKIFGEPCRGMLESSRWAEQKHRQKLLEEAVREFRPDMLFVIRGNGFAPDFVRYLKQRYRIGKTVCWWVKGPKWFDLMLSDKTGYDHYYCMHRDGYDESDGIRYLAALAVDTSLYYRMPERKPQDRAVFVGGWNSLRQQVVQELTEFPVGLYGPNWRRKNLFNPKVRAMVRAKGMWGKEICELYNNSAVVLNISAWNPSLLSGLNLRVLDVIACGAFLLTQYSDDLRQFLVPGREVETFRNAEECRDKLRFYLGNPAAREKMIIRGYSRVCRMRTYRDLMLELLADLETVAGAGQLQLQKAVA